MKHESLLPETSPKSKQSNANNHQTFNLTAKSSTQQYTSKIGRRFGKYTRTLNKEESDLGTNIGDNISLSATPSI